MKIGQNQVRAGEPRKPTYPRMNSDSNEFSEELTSCTREGFEAKFARIAHQMKLDGALKRQELARLSEAAFLAALCNIAFNGLGGCSGTTSPDKEITRRNLELAYMDARHNFQRSSGWKKLSAAQNESIYRVFLKVIVEDQNLAG